MQCRFIFLFFVLGMFSTGKTGRVLNPKRYSYRFIACLSKKAGREAYFVRQPFYAESPVRSSQSLIQEER